MPNELRGRAALVTGAGRGIGRGCAVELARRGAEVVINDRDGALLREAAAEIADLGAVCHSLPEDVFSRDGCERVVEGAVRSAGRIDILVSNPAYSRRAPFLDYLPEEFEQTIRGTLTSGFHICQLVARHMVGRGEGGSMVLISSVQAEMPLSHSAPYGAAKAGLNHLGRSMAVELAPHRIRVNVIEPGWIDTEGERRVFSDETIESEGRRLPWGRLGLPADIGRAAAFLASPDADYITGVVLPVDGLFRYKDCLSVPPTKPTTTA